MHTFVAGEITLIVEALARAAKRQASEARWHQVRDNEKLSSEHDKKARAMRKLILKLETLTSLQGTVRS